MTEVTGLTKPSNRPPDHRRHAERRPGGNAPGQLHLPQRPLPGPSNGRSIPHWHGGVPCLRIRSTAPIAGTCSRRSARSASSMAMKISGGAAGRDRRGYWCRARGDADQRDHVVDIVMTSLLSAALQPQCGSVPGLGAGDRSDRSRPSALGRDRRLLAFLWHAAFHRSDNFSVRLRPFFGESSGNDRTPEKSGRSIMRPRRR